MTAQKKIFSIYFLKNSAILLVVLTAVIFFSFVFKFLFYNSAKFVFLIWNLFLAWIPFVMSMTICYIYPKAHIRAKKVLMYTAGLIWLVFFPNTLYMITDYIHLTRNNYITMDMYSMNFNDQFLIWYEFVQISLSVWIASAVGYISLFSIHMTIKTAFSRLAGWIFVIVVLLLSSFGIFLGRFLRWNSWDLFLNPVSLLDNTIKSLNSGSIGITLLFGVLLVSVYLIFYNLTYMDHYHE